MAKYHVHTVYKLKNGTRVPGVTTIVGIMDKPALVAWANRIGLEGIEVGKYVDDKADIGTLAHNMVMAHITGGKADTKDYSANQIEQAEWACLSFYEWAKGKHIEPLFIETP